MRESEFNRRYDVKTGRYVKKHIYGEGVTDVFKTIGRKLFGKTMKEAAKTATKKAVQKAATKTGEYAGEKAGNKIIQLLSKKNKKTPVAASPVPTSPIEKPQSRELSDYEINLAPEYLCAKFKKRSSVRNRTTRNNEKFEIPLFRSATGQRTFAYRAVSLWNTLDEDLRNDTTVKAFTKALKLVMNE